MAHKPMYVGAILCTLTLAAVAQSPAEPWKLTLDERIALRTKAELARERVRDRTRTQASSAASAPSDARQLADSFDGKTHPELFLPHEVFRKLVKLAFQASPRTCQVFRDGLTPEVRRHGLPDDFWNRLEALSAAHVADVWMAADLAATVGSDSGPARERAANALALKRIEVCRSRADALAAARSTFGQDRFDRFMYEAIAVNMFHASGSLPDPQQLHDAERGCR
jgi:hypothetical protein